MMIKNTSKKLINIGFFTAASILQVNVQANEILQLNFEGSSPSQYNEWQSNGNYKLIDDGIIYVLDPFSDGRVISNSIVPTRVTPGASTGAPYDGVWVLKTRLYENDDGAKDRSQLVVREHHHNDGVKIGGDEKFLGFAWKSVYTPNATTDTFSMIGYQQNDGPNQAKNVTMQLVGKKDNGDFILKLNIFDNNEVHHGYEFRAGDSRGSIIHNNDWNTTIIETQFNGPNDSIVRIWLNDVKVLEETSLKIGYTPDADPDGISEDFKTTLGLYRNKSHGENDLVSMYYDNIKFANTKDAANP